MSGTQGPAAIAVVTLAVLTLLGCHSPARPMRPVGAPGRWYVVEAGETLADLARRAGVPEEDLLEVNGLSSASEVQPGRLLFVLDAQRPELPEWAAVAPSSSAPPVVPPARSPRFRWPVDAPRITSLFGSRWGKMHEGIDLTAPVGTPVYAAGAGEVVYAGSVVRGYGNMIVLKHESDLMTVYAHNSVLLVKVGDRVGIGQRVALSGQSGRATGPHVHFEVRRREIPRDPLPYLPDLRAVRERSPKS
jgi:murein DD-endopeptidase MepM/ murein hydrolase activator NlpD